MTEVVDVWAETTTKGNHIVMEGSGMVTNKFRVAEIKMIADSKMHLPQKNLVKTTTRLNRSILLSTLKVSLGQDSQLKDKVDHPLQKFLQVVDLLLKLKPGLTTEMNQSKTEIVTTKKLTKRMSTTLVDREMLIMNKDVQLSRTNYT